MKKHYYSWYIAFKLFTLFVQIGKQWQVKLRRNQKFNSPYSGESRIIFQHTSTEISAGDTFPLQKWIDKSKATANINPVFLVDISRSPSLDILCKYSRSLRRTFACYCSHVREGRLPIKRRRFTPWAADIKSADFCGLREREFDHLLSERFSALSPSILNF